MSTECDRFDALQLDQGEGVPLSSADRQFVASHGAVCDRCHELEAGLSLLAASLGPPAPIQSDALADERLIRAVVRQAQSEGRTRRSNVWRVAAVAAMLVGGVVAWQLLGRVDRGSSKPIAASKAEVPLEPVVVKPEIASLPRVEARAVATVSLTRGGSLPVGATLDEGSLLEARSGPLGVTLGRFVFVWFAKGTRAHLRSLRDDGMEITLEGGQVNVSVVPHQRVALAVVPPWGQVKVVGTVFSVTATRHGGGATVKEGRVQVERPNNEPLLLEAGQRFSVGGSPVRLSESEQGALTRFEQLALLARDGATARLGLRAASPQQSLRVDGVDVGAGTLEVAVPPGRHQVELRGPGKARQTREITLREGIRTELDGVAPAREPRREAATQATGGPGPTPSNEPVDRGEVSVDELVKQALQARAAQDWQRAAEIYQQIQRTYPSLAAARASRVSLGQLQIDRLGHAREGLSLCERYLQDEPSGPLAIEAAVCRVRAFQALGNQAEERTAIEAFLARWPAEFHAPSLQRRLDALKSASP